MRYGDYDNVTKDSKTLYEIYDRQGSSLLIEVLAERAGEAALKYGMNDSEKRNMVKSLVAELAEALWERV